MWLSIFPGHVGSSLGFCCTDGVAVQSGKSTDPMLPAVPVCSSVFQWPIRQKGSTDHSISSRSQQLSHPILGATMTSRFGGMLCASWTPVSWCLLMFPWPNSTRGRCNTMEVRQIWRRWRPMHWSLALKGSPFLFHFWKTIMEGQSILTNRRTTSQTSYNIFLLMLLESHRKSHSGCSCEWEFGPWRLDIIFGLVSWKQKQRKAPCFHQFSCSDAATVLRCRDWITAWGQGGPIVRVCYFSSKQRGFPKMGHPIYPRIMQNMLFYIGKPLV